MLTKLSTSTIVHTSSSSNAPKMHLTRALGASLYFGQAFCSGISTHHESVGGKNDVKLAVVRNDRGLCPLTRGQLGFDVVTSQFNASSDPKSTTCIWTDNHEKQYCAFADPHFNHGKGITVITTPERAKHIFKRIAALSLSSHPKVSHEVLFRTTASGTKGRGIFATKHIAAGSTITQEPPMVLIDRNWMVDVSSEEVRTAIQVTAIEMLPRATRQAVFELYPGPHGETLKERLWTNGYGVSGGPTPDLPGLENGSDHGLIAVHANISKINHSCRANAAAQWDYDLLAHRLYAARDIAADEEITMSYFNTIQILRTRQEHARNFLEFECACNQCKSQRKFTDLSDDRINEILLLESYLERRETAPAEPTAMAELLVSLYKAEGLENFIYKAYALAAREWNGAGYEYQARLWAYESVKAGLIAGSGTGMDEYAKDMEALLDGARKHWSWRYRVHS